VPEVGKRLVLTRRLRGTEGGYKKGYVQIGGFPGSTPSFLPCVLASLRGIVGRLAERCVIRTLQMVCERVAG